MSGREKSRDARGYGSAHKALRKSWVPVVAAGGVACARCGKAIVPGSPWDLGHVDGDKSRYAGPEHRSCNQRAGARQGAAITNARRWGRRPRRRRVSRVW